MVTARKKGSPILVGAIFLIIGLGALVGGVLWGLRTQRFVSSAERAKGTVTDLDMRSDSDGTAYYPVVSYTTKEGREVTFTSATGGNPPPKRRGDEVEVLYEAANPEEAEKAFHELKAPVVAVKAQIHAGGRGKAGCIKVLKTAADARSAAK